MAAQRVAVTDKVLYGKVVELDEVGLLTAENIAVVAAFDPDLVRSLAELLSAQRVQLDSKEAGRLKAAAASIAAQVQADLDAFDQRSESFNEAWREAEAQYAAMSELGPGDPTYEEWLLNDGFWFADDMERYEENPDADFPDSWAEDRAALDEERASIEASLPGRVEAMSGQSPDYLSAVEQNTRLAEALKEARALCVQRQLESLKEQLNQPKAEPQPEVAKAPARKPRSRRA